MPFDSLAQGEGRPRAVLVPFPSAGQVGHDRFQPVLRGVLIEQDQVVVDAHQRPLAPGRRLLVDVEARRAVGAVYSKDTPTLLRDGATSGAHRDQHSHNGAKQITFARHFHLPDPMRRSADLFVSGAAALPDISGFLARWTRFSTPGGSRGNEIRTQPTR